MIELIEGFPEGVVAFAAKGRAVVSLGELGGVVRVALHEYRHRVVEIPPTSRAKYATGKGNAGKAAVLAEAIRRLGYQGHSNDEADALWLYAMAADHYGFPLVAMPEVNRSALDKIVWPRCR